jgi:hypothetical protein
VEQPKKPSSLPVRESVRSRAAVADPRAEPDHGIPGPSRIPSDVIHQKGLGSGLVPAIESRIHELERQVEEHRRQQAIDTAKIADLSSEIIRADVRLNEANELLRAFALALDDVGDAQTRARETLAALKKLLNQGS